MGITPMTDKHVSVEIDVVAAAHVRKVLFDHQQPYSYEYAPERVTLIREVIRVLDTQIEEALKEE